ncbi:hypothetical protein [Streptoalloteichus tenebrarius]|uniref:hypothetical protein n=1 Tax=Streptoalloteichus tenebrarius (strain ATCC 17920 / DSM 40477 / JCM 4838 / CBS 697.72 / NBRC 16177 / NCIMB 11028 / NRRL B-12390 / A12253. 1 / ISP 5477) TaxID=1933 RepID=UPI0020A453E7|nr:hypothetical protein [Streptoalloteichus tenebrarius]
MRAGRVPEEVLTPRAVRMLCGDGDGIGQRDRGVVRSLRAAVDAEGRAIDGFSVALEGSGEAWERVHRAWEAGVRDAIGWLNGLAAQVDEAVPLMRVLVEQRRRLTS